MAKNQPPPGSHQFEPIDLDFDKMNGVVPYILQHAYTGEILMLGVLNDESWRRTCETGILTSYRRTLGRVWTMGEDGGHFIKVTRVKVDCDDDTVLFETIPEAPVCGHGQLTCFFNELPAKEAHGGK